jgi:hypothetical protein
VLGSADGPSFLAASMFEAVELLKGRIDVVATNSVCWGSRSVLVAAMSHFPELKTELEVLRSGCSSDLTEDKSDALWIRVHVASDSLASHVPSLGARNPPNDVGE